MSGSASTVWSCPLTLTLNFWVAMGCVPPEQRFVGPGAYASRNPMGTGLRRCGLPSAPHTLPSSPAKAGDPVIEELSVVTGCPAFAGHDAEFGVSFLPTPGRLQTDPAPRARRYRA